VKRAVVVVIVVVVIVVVVEVVVVGLLHNFHPDSVTPLPSADHVNEPVGTTFAGPMRPLYVRPFTFIVS